MTGARRLAGVCVVLSALALAAASSATHDRRPTPPRTRTLTVEVNGDILVQRPIWERALRDGHGRYDFTPMLRELAPYVKSADLAICHVETPMTPRPITGYPVFNTPTRLARAIRLTGWRICDTASNHSVDQGQYGIDETGRALDRAGVLHTGSFASPGTQRRTLMVDVKGVRVAFLAYTEFTNGIQLPHPWSVNVATVARVEHDARVARQRGAQVVIVNFHWGDQFIAQPSAFQMDMARALTRDPDITAIVGQHVHIVQPISRVNGKLVVFGEGQIVSDEPSPCCPLPQTEDGMLVFLHIVVTGERSSVAGITYLPTWDRRPDYKALPIDDAFRRHQEALRILRASYRRTVSVVGRIRGVVGPIPARLP
jgi:poly-gamma-glutamate capsule biosynthesis protein CapA/YwtB (metallophosphatase superfamily)